MKKFLPTFAHRRVNKSRGFTLVELLVVISIIAILAVIGLTVFAGVQKNARDSKRRGDIDGISKALEVAYNNSTGQYPAVTGSMFSGGVIPTDPLGGSYSGLPAAAVSTYNVCADLEADGRAPTDTTPNDYCIAQQQ